MPEPVSYMHTREELLPTVVVPYREFNSLSGKVLIGCRSLSIRSAV